ncbi:hypothetical protein BaRGS_00021968 [Batillaria attramentaria]|uniref:Secreted protein n=1 Tax=Batillaria attramentaria TaxID=370345 RepID=A0ABD0KHY7_9CAEN
MCVCLVVAKSVDVLVLLVAVRLRALMTEGVGLSVPEAPPLEHDLLLLLLLPRVPLSPRRDSVSSLGRAFRLPPTDEVSERAGLGGAWKLAPLPRRPLRSFRPLIEGTFADWSSSICTSSLASAFGFPTTLQIRGRLRVTKGQFQSHRPSLSSRDNEARPVTRSKSDCGQDHRASSWPRTDGKLGEKPRALAARVWIDRGGSVPRHATNVLVRLLLLAAPLLLGSDWYWLRRGECNADGGRKHQPVISNEPHTAIDKTGGYGSQTTCPSASQSSRQL